MSLRDLRAQLEAGAEKVGEGRFRVDQKRALAKLRDYRLADPHHYALELLRAAALSGAKKVEARCDADDFELHCDGQPLAPEVMGELLSFALCGEKSEERRRARLLALGMAGAMGLSPSWVRVRSGGLLLTLVPPDSLKLKPTSAQRGTSIHVRKRLGWGVAKAALFGPAEAAAILEHARCFPLPLWLNGKRVDEKEPFPGPHLAQAEIRAPGLWLFAAVPAEPMPHTRLTFDLHGVAVVTRTLQLPAVQLLGYARSDSLRRNASGSDVHDEDAAQLGGKLAGLGEELLQGLVTRLLGGPDEALRARLTEVALRALGPSAQPSPKVRSALERAPILPGAAGEWLSISELKKEQAEGRLLKFGRRRYPPGSYSPPAVLLEASTRWVEPLLPAPPRRDVEEEVRGKLLAAENRRRWSRCPQEEPRLSGKGYLARTSFEGGGLRGEVGVEPQAAESVIRLLCMGKLLAQEKAPQLSPLRVRAVVDLEREPKAEAWANPPGPWPRRRVLEAVDRAAQKAILETLAQPRLSQAAREHGRDSLIRLSQQKDRRLAELPPELLAAPLLPRVGGGWLSLSELTSRPSWRYSPSPRPHPLLSEAPAAVLGASLRQALVRLGGEEQLRDVSDQLRCELEVRARLSGPREEPVVKEKLVSVPVEAEGMRGEVAIPRELGSQLSLQLYREGFLLEQCSLSARYQLAQAAIDCPALRPAESWRHARRDQVYQRVLEAVREGERRLLLAILATFQPPLSAPLPCRRYLVAFLRKELSGFRRRERLDQAQQAAAKARLFLTEQGPISLEEAARVAEQAGRIWLLPVKEPPAVPEGMRLFLGDRGVGMLLSELLELPWEDAWGELERARRREAFRKKPAVEPGLPQRLEIRAPLSAPGLQGEAGFDLTRAAGAEVEVLVEGRPFLKENFPAHLPLLAIAAVEGVDPAELSLPAEKRECLRQALSQAQRAMVERALQEPEQTRGRALLLHALGNRLDAAQPSLKLSSLRLFPCTDGRKRSAEELPSQGLRYVTEPLSGEPLSGQPVMVAVEPALRVALGRWTEKVDLTEALKRELRVRRQRAQIPPRERIELSLRPLAQRSFSHLGIEGEVGLVPQGGGRLELFHQRRPLCVVEEPALPEVLSAAANHDRIDLDADHAGVVRTSPAYQELVQEVTREAALLLSSLAESLQEDEVQRLAPLLAQGAAWMLRQEKSCPRLFQLPLLLGSSGEPLSLAALLSEQERRGRVAFSPRQGALLRKDRLVFRPRPGEERLLEGLGLKLSDVTLELEHAERVRARPKLEKVEAPLDCEWREPVLGRRMEGEVALPPFPSEKLLLELFRQRQGLETLELKHPVGGVARVNCDLLSPNVDWTRAIRNRAFRELREAVEAALERLLTRYLQAGAKEPGFFAYARAAVGWRFDREGPLGEALLTLPLFEDLAGKPVTVGRVLEEHSLRRSVAVAAVGLRGTGSLVLADRPTTRALLTRMKLKVEDISAEIRQAAELEASRQRRRLSRLEYPGRALLRMRVDAEGLKGELALPSSPEEKAVLVLCRQAVAVGRLSWAEALGVAGGLEHPELPVDEQWEQLQPSPELASLLEQKVDALFLQLARAAAELGSSERKAAARYALRCLARAGMSSAAHLDRLQGPASALAGAPLFQTCDGRWVDLRSIAEWVLRHGSVEAVRPSLLGGEVEGELVLAAEDLAARWLDELEALLGSGRVVRLQSLDQWRRERSERDPEPGSPLRQGLTRLRKELKLLRAGALGHLSPDELGQLRLCRAGGGTPIRYDPTRRTVLLDPQAPGVEQALSEAGRRPERLYVLLAAIYGAVNRELERITFEHEAELVSALASHLTANPALCRTGCAGDSVPISGSADA